MLTFGLYTCCINRRLFTLPLVCIINEKYKNMEENKLTIKGDGFIEKGWDNIISFLRKRTLCKSIVAIDCYIGIDYENIKKHIAKIDPILFIDTKDLFISEDKINDLVEKHTSDISLSNISLSDYFDFEKLQKARNAIDRADDNVVIFGSGAHLVSSNDILIYVDSSHKYLVNRINNHENGTFTIHSGNTSEQYKKKLLSDLIILDQHKKMIIPYVDYWIDTLDSENSKMIDKKTFNQIKRTFENTHVYKEFISNKQVLSKEEILEIMKNPYLHSNKYALYFDDLIVKFKDADFVIPAVDFMI